jgi:hypothetical protein
MPLKPQRFRKRDLANSPLVRRFMGFKWEAPASAFGSHPFERREETTEGVAAYRITFQGGFNQQSDMILEDSPTAARLSPTRISINIWTMFHNFFTLLIQRLAKEPFPTALLLPVRPMPKFVCRGPNTGRCSPGPPRAALVARFTPQASHLLTPCVGRAPSRSRV